MKVHIVTEGVWIKRYWADMIIKYKNDKIDYTLSTSPINNTDVNFYICYNTFLPFKKSNVKDVGYVTHIHANSIQEHSKDIGKSFEKFRELDAWIHQSQRSLNQFLDMKYPPEKNFLLTSAIVTNKFKPSIKLGIVQNGEVVGKGLYFLIDLLDHYDFSNFKFIICGRGWELFIDKLKAKNIRYEIHGYNTREYYENKQAEVYDKIDYFFVPSLWEGGPVAVMEALASGKPIIASNVGYIPEFNVEYMYEPNDINGLINILKTIETPVIERVKKVKGLDFTNYNEKLFTILSNL